MKAGRDGARLPVISHFPWEICARWQEELVVKREIHRETDPNTEGGIILRRHGNKRSLHKKS